MDNRYLFRGKRLDNGEWVVGYYRINRKREHLIYPNDYSRHNNIKDFCFECFEVDPSTIGQCTGLHAAKSYRGESDADKLIFEGDILRFVHPHIRRAVEYEVVYEKYQFNCKDFYHTHFDYPTDAFSEGAQYFEIIGTIHEKEKLIGGDVSHDKTTSN